MTKGATLEPGTVIPVDGPLASLSLGRPVGLALLRVPFAAHHISKLPKPTSKDAKKGKCAECGGWHGLPAVHLDYVGHAALTDRLLDADPSWNWEPLSWTEDGLPRFDASGGLWIKLTVCGMTRLGYGHAEHKPYADPGAREKEVIGDALRNAAMRFGAALDLWHRGQLVRPDGYDDWAADFEAVALEGMDALRDMFKATRAKRSELTDYLVKHDNTRYEAAKAKAAKVQQ